MPRLTYKYPGKQSLLAAQFSPLCGKVDCVVAFLGDAEAESVERWKRGKRLAPAANKEANRGVLASLARASVCPCTSEARRGIRPASSEALGVAWQ